MSKSELDLQSELIEDLCALERRPFDFAMWAFPWGEEGTDLAPTVLVPNPGLEDWQRRVLLDLQLEMLSAPADAHSAIIGAYLIAIASGKNVGKTALLAIITLWAFTTRQGTKGRATANTKTQLSSVFWAELAKWLRLFIAKEFFAITATQLFSTDPKWRKEWFFDAIPWSKDNPDAWAGLHNQGGRILMLFDEGAEIDDAIWERADGATREANTEVIWIATSNPTRNIGRFYECFHKFKDMWHTYNVDSREVRLTDHVALEKALATWGIEDDYSKVQILGQFPASSFMQLIPREAVELAQKRHLTTQPWEPLILGVDVARFGNNASCATFRQGRDCRSIPREERRGLTVPETGMWIISLISTHQPDGVFIDEGGVGAGVVDFVRLLGYDVIGINFGASPSMPCEALASNKRSEMYINARTWLRTGGCLPTSDEDFTDEATSIQYHYDRKQAIQLMSKEDMRSVGIPSPDRTDSWVLTFALPCAKKLGGRTHKGLQFDYDPLSLSALPGHEEQKGRFLDLLTGKPMSMN